ncbi:MAG TPA: response regulator [Terriglobales bacterium]|nr:response regulator [Terriglobales bacterium]
MAKILIADDSRFQVELVASGLRQKGHEISVAQDVVQAGMLALRNSPDLIVLDVNMPGGSGIEVLKRLRRSAKTQNIPVVVVSGSCDNDVQHVAMELGAVEFLRKPVDVEQLSSLLTGLLSAKEREKALH